jgi:putative heme-binding domain-containing protein
MSLFAMTRFIFLCCLVAALARSGESALVFHLDAAGQPSARGAAGLPSIGNNQPLDILVDTSSNRLVSFQPIPDRRPLFVTDGPSAYLKFDGKDDFLSFAPGLSPAAELTLFILAAPHENPGFFTGLFGASRIGRNDYIDGINFDFGPGPTRDLSVLNVESAGSTGFRDMLTPGFLNAADRPFADFHVFTVRTKPGKAGTEVFLDGFKGGERERSDSRIAMDQAVIGGRLYSNDPLQPPFAQGFFNGAIAEVLVYDTALSEEERRRIEQEMLARTVGLNALLHGLKGHALEPVKDPPVVQMLAPGFTVEELPVKIGNLTNVRYRRDGKLVGQGYDGRIYLLSDTNGDGLEDKTDLFWDQPTLRSPIGIALTPDNDPRGDGIFVASKGKVSLILDKDRDGRADQEIVIASGWPEPFHNVDCLGLAVDPRDGSIYFGRGCANFVEAYLIDKTTGRSQYRLEDERGTIQRISADFSTREIICTGVRYTCSLAFNANGDLFATDQEGATWLPNGNPLDELLQIERGKHYGFPPRHPKHLPDVIDEPAVSEYGPQHQSTVGLTFNEGIRGGPHFGPAHWKNDALVTGESRGKLYRTRLAKTPMGYVAQNHLVACLSMLAVDLCVTPAGDLVVACHSGPPDWGTGPAGQGRIFKIRYTGRDLPQPVLAWAAAPDEFRISFDRPLDPSDWVNAQKQTRIEAGEHVRAGDRFEVIRPGYQVVRDQMAAPRRSVEVLGLTLTEDRRELVLRVPRQTEPVTYAVTLPLPDRWKQRGGISQHPQIDLALTLNGVAASITSKDSTRKIVLPHPSLSASAELTRGSAEHERFFRDALDPGATLAISGKIATKNPFVPAVQPGSKLDWNPATNPFASKRFFVKCDYASERDVSLTDPGNGRFQSFNVTNVTRANKDANGLFLADENFRHRVATSQLLVPWSTETQSGSSNTLALNRTDVKGNWLRGKWLFSREAGCATCHVIRGSGTAFGPDLSNLVFRDRDSVLQDILQPSATINPDHTGSTVTLDDGTEQSGLIRTLDAEKVVLALPGGAQLEYPRSRVTRIDPMKTSVMPAGIVEQLTSSQLEDLLTFLLTDSLLPAPITRTDPARPAPRTRAEIEQVLALRQDAGSESTLLRILLVAGPKDHGPDEHDYPLWLERWSRLLALAENVTVTTSMRFPTREQLAAADVAVFYNANNDWNPVNALLLDEFHQRGGGVVYLHYAIDGGKDPAAAADRFGLAFTLGSKFRHGEFDLIFKQTDHPITRGFPALHFTDETYWNMRGDPSRVNILGTSAEENSPQPELWTLERKKSRVVACIPGHYTWTFDDPLYRILVLRSICWAARERDVDRLGELAAIGAIVRD